jgi:hypothetical protein
LVFLTRIYGLNTDQRTTTDARFSINYCNLESVGIGPPRLDAKSRRVDPHTIRGSVLVATEQLIQPRVIAAIVNMRG